MGHGTDIEEGVPQIPLVLEQCEGAAPPHKRVVVVANFVPDKAHVRGGVGIAGIHEVIPTEQIKDLSVVLALVRAEINPARQGQRLRRFVAEGGEHTVPVVVVEEFAQDAPGLQQRVAVRWIDGRAEQATDGVRVVKFLEVDLPVGCVVATAEAVFESRTSAVAVTRVGHVGDVQLVGDAPAVAQREEGLVVLVLALVQDLVVEHAPVHVVVVAVAHEAGRVDEVRGGDFFLEVVG